jgi:hypothetical protein
MFLVHAGLAVHDDADPTTCLAALLELVNAQLPLERLQPGELHSVGLEEETKTTPGVESVLKNY